MLHLLITLVLPAQMGAALPADSVAALQWEARRAEAAYERLSRQRAPRSWSAYTGAECDEIVGRFCLNFDSTTARPEAAEDPDVAAARAAAVAAARAWFEAVPTDRRAAGPLIRLLIVDGRMDEAVAAAHRFDAAADPLWGQLLLGLAMHAAGADSSAELHFARALAGLPPSERRRWLDPDWLIEPGAARELRRLPDPARMEVERRLWLRADPFWMTAANERWVEHIARWVQARLLADVPRVVDMPRWAADLDELTVRYGVPVSRGRSRGPAGTTRSGMVEYWDSAQRAYTPARPASLPPTQPAPGERPALYSARARSAYAYAAVERVLELEHQATRFMAGDEIVLRFDGRVPLPSDSSAVPGEAVWRRAAAQPREPVAVAAVAYDSAFVQRRQAVGRAAWRADTALFTLYLRVPAGPTIYGVEALDTAAGVAARARYRLPVLGSTGATGATDTIPAGDRTVPGPVVSDLLITHSFAPGPLPVRYDDGRIEARSSLVVGRGDTLGVYAEVYPPTPRAGTPFETAGLAIELRLESLERPSLLGSAVRWLGRTVGLIGPEQAAPAVSWREDVDGGAHVIALNLPLDPAARGLYDIVLRVTDAASGMSTEMRRTIRVIDVPARG